MESDCYYYSWGGNFKKDFTSYPREYGARCQFFDKFFGHEGPNCKGCKEFLKDARKRIKPTYFYQFDNRPLKRIFRTNSDEEAVLKAKKELKRQKISKQKIKGIRVFKLIHEEK